MTIKKLSPEIPLEHDYEGRFENELWCYAAVILDVPAHWKDRWGLGIAVADKPGYFPISGDYAHADSYEVMMDHADDLNRQRGITRAQSAIIIASTMGGRGARSSRERRRA